MVIFDPDNLGPPDEGGEEAQEIMNAGIAAHEGGRLTDPTDMTEGPETTEEMKEFVEAYENTVKAYLMQLAVIEAWIADAETPGTVKDRLKRRREGINNTIAGIKASIERMKRRIGGG